MHQTQQVALNQNCTSISFDSYKTAQGNVQDQNSNFKWLNASFKYTVRDQTLQQHNTYLMNNIPKILLGTISNRCLQLPCLLELCFENLHYIYEKPLQSKRLFLYNSWGTEDHHGQMGGYCHCRKRENQSPRSQHDPINLV